MGFFLNQDIPYLNPAGLDGYPAFEKPHFQLENCKLPLISFSTSFSTTVTDFTLNKGLFCETVLSGKDKLKNHILSIREGKMPFNCEICDYTLVYFTIFSKRF